MTSSVEADESFELFRDEFVGADDIKHVLQHHNYVVHFEI